MEAITALQNAYADSSDNDNSSDNDVAEIDEDSMLHLKPLTSESKTGVALSTVNSNPEVITKVKKLLEFKDIFCKICL